MLDTDCSWNALERLQQALEPALNELGVRIDTAEVDGPPIRLSDDRGIVVRLLLPLTLEATGDIADAVIDIPSVTETGAVVHRGRDLAPTAFLRLATDAHSGWSRGPNAGPELPLPEDIAAGVEAGTGDDPYEADVGPLSSVDGDGLDDPGHGDDPGTGEPSFAEEVELYANLENCRLLLAGHHLAAAIEAGAILAAETLAAAGDEARTEGRALLENGDDLKRYADSIATSIMDRVDQAMHGSSADLEGGVYAFEPIDDTNPLSRFEHCRKVSRLGPGGVGIHTPLAEALRDIHPSQHGRLCPFNTPDSERVGLVRYLTLDAEVDGDGRFAPVAPLEDLTQAQVLSASALLLPLLNHNDAVRGVLATKTLKQFVPLAHPEPPLIRTGEEEVVSARLGLSGRADLPGRARVLSGHLDYRTNAGAQLAYEPLRTHPAVETASGTDDSWITTLTGELDSPGINVGWTPVTDGQMLWRRPGTVVEDKNVLICPGVNVRCAVMPFRGLTIEDAVVVSRTLAERMTSHHLERVVERLGPDELATTPPSQLIGRTVVDNEILFDVVGPSPVDGSAPGLALRRQIRSPFGGTVLEVAIDETDIGETLVRIIVRVDRPLEAGDKLIARHGNKGVVAAVLDDAEMPVIRSFAGPGAPDLPAELVISPFGPLRRMVMGLFHELALGRVAQAGVRIEPQPPLDAVGIDDVVASVEGGDGPGWTAAVDLPDGRALDEVAVGSLYLLKLNHLAQRKVQAQGWTPQSPMNGQPSRVRVDEHGRRLGRPTRIGEMEFWALQACGADALISDAMGARRGNDSAMPNSLWAVLDHLHAAGFVATLEFSTGDRVDSRDFRDIDSAAAEHNCTLTSLSIDLAERRRLAGTDADSAQAWTPDDVVDLEEAVVAAALERQAAKEATPRVGDKRNRVERTLRRVLRGGDLIPEGSDVACACSPLASGIAGETCPRCRRVRHRVPSLAEQHQLLYLDLASPVVHPWFLSKFLGGCRAVAARDEPMWTLLREATDDDTWRERCENRTSPIDPEVADQTREVVPWVRDLTITPRLEWSCVRRCLELPSTGDDPPARRVRDALAWTVSYLPILPPAQRPVVRGGEGQAVYDRLDARYLAVYEEAHRAPLPHDDPGSYRRLKQAVAAVLGFAGGPKAGEGTLAHRLRFKEGLLRRYLLGSSAWSTAYGVIVPDPTLAIDQVGVPLAVMNELGLSDGDWVLVNRSPTLLRTGVLGMRAFTRSDSAVSLPPAVLPMLAGDFDGDMVALHRPSTAEAQDELSTLLHPGRNLRSPATGEPLVLVGEELATDPLVRAELVEVAGRIADAHFDGHGDGLAAAVEELRLTSNSAYERLTGVASVALADLIDRDLRVDVLAAARSGGFGSSAETQCLEVVGDIGTYASRLELESPVHVDGCFRDGLDRVEIERNARGAMPRLGDKKLITPVAGDFTKVLVEALYDVVTVDDDCGSQARVPTTRLSLRADRRSDGDEGVRSPLECRLMQDDPTRVCRSCYGDDLSTGRPVAGGTRVGLLAAQAIGERGTQLALKAIHAGARGTELDRVLAPLVTLGRVEVPTIAPDGSMSWVGDGASIVDDPLAIVGLYRWAYTPQGQRHEPRAVFDLDDIHLELAVASMASAARQTKLTALGGSLSRQSFLARATMRGNLSSILAAVDPKSKVSAIASVDDLKTRLILAPGTKGGEQ